MRYFVLYHHFTSFLRPYVNNSSINTCQVYTLHSILSKFLHGSRDLEEDRIHEICTSLRNGHNWETLNKKFESIELSNSLVEKTLVELRDPLDAKRGLGFFHWVAKRKGFVHGVNSYAVMIHVLVRGRLITDAQALIESVLRKHGGRNDDSKFVVVDSLVGSYERFSPCSLVFDLLIRGYAKLRMFEVGFDVCCYLGEMGFDLNVVSFNTLMHVVEKSGKFTLVWKIYEHMIQTRVLPNEATTRIMVNSLCKEGKLQVCIDMLDSIAGKRCSPLVVVNTCLLLKVLDEGRIDVGMTLLKIMLQKKIISDTAAYSLIIFAKVRLGNLNSALELHEEIVKRGFNVNSFVCSSLLGGYCDAGRIDDAKLLLQEMESMGLKVSSETFNLLIEGCCRNGRVKESLSYCDIMMERGLVPSTRAFNTMLAKLQEIGDVKWADEILTRLLDKGFLSNETTYSHLIAGYARDNDVHNALKLYYEMEYSSIVPESSVLICLVKSLCRCGKLEAAEQFIRKMKDRSIDPNVDVYEALILGYIEKGDKTRAIYFHDEMLSKGLSSPTMWNIGKITFQDSKS